MGGESLVRRMTNAIRPGGVVSLRVSDEAQPPMPAIGTRPPLRGSVRKRAVDTTWVVGDGTGSTAVHVKQGDLGRERAVFMRSGAEEPHAPGVRAVIVAGKRRNGRGAKGRREVTA
jgi:hypothetical protein